MEGLAATRERDIVIERFLALAPHEQHVVYRLIRDRLALPLAETKRDRVVLERAAALESLATVAHYLRLREGEAPTPTQFDVAARELGLRTDRNRVRRAFGKWRFAKAAFVGGDQSAATDGNQRRSGAGRASRYEAHMVAIGRWLESEPNDRRLVSYVEWARRYNDDLPVLALPLPLRADLIGETMNVVWPDLVRIVAGEITAAQARPRTKRHRERFCRGPHELASYEDIVEILGRSGKAVRAAMAGPDFPPPVVVLGHTRLWLRGDVEAHRDGVRDPVRQLNEFRRLYLTVGEITALTGLGRNPIESRTRGFPEAVVRLGRAKLWLREDIDEWLNVHSAAP